jgi:LmbE family N-acetylglucosaminyl deacetylase
MALLTEVPASALAVYAHPDDPEVSCAGTLAAWSAAGARVHVVVCTRGDKGSSDPGTDPDDLARVRAAEAEAAAAVMGLAGHEILGYPDGEIDNTVELRHQLVERIRRLRPEVVVGPDPTAVFFGDSYVNHHDHREVGWALLDACVPMSGSPLYFPDAGAAYVVSSVLLSGTLVADTWVDIADQIDAKVAALRCHRSQIGDGDDLVADVVRSRAEEAGRDAGVRYAEGFRRLSLGR